MFTDLEKEILRGIWGQIVPFADSWVEVFYKRVFEQRPELRTLFPLDMTAQKRKFVRLVAFVVKSVDFPDAAWRDAFEPREDLFLVLLALGRRHDEFYRVPRDAYSTFGEALSYALEHVLRERFNAEARAVWEKLYAALALGLRLGTATVSDQVDSVSADEVQRLGEQALLGQMADSNIEARFGFAQEPL